MDQNSTTHAAYNRNGTHMDEEDELPLLQVVSSSSDSDPESEDSDSEYEIVGYTHKFPRIESPCEEDDQKPQTSLKKPCTRDQIENNRPRLESMPDASHCDCDSCTSISENSDSDMDADSCEHCRKPGPKRTGTKTKNLKRFSDRDDEGYDADSEESEDGLDEKMEGGARRNVLSVGALLGFNVHSGTLLGLPDSEQLLLEDVVCQNKIQTTGSPYTVLIELPISTLAEIATLNLLHKITRHHNIKIPSSHRRIRDTQNLIYEHNCSNTCKLTLALFKRPLFNSTQSLSTTWRVPLRAHISGEPAEPLSYEMANEQFSFPPLPKSKTATAQFAREWVTAIQPENIAEKPCGVCARGLPENDLLSLDATDPSLQLLYEFSAQATDGRITASDGMEILCQDALYDNNGSTYLYICKTCYNSLKKHKQIPRMALSNGLWLGDVPPELQKLNYVEKLVVARYRHNVCTAEIEKFPGRKRMKVNAVVFSQPVAKFYTHLPPPADELSECLAILFTGATDPTKEDYTHTPFLIRRTVVWTALTWLKDNNSQYNDVQLSYENLMTYPEDIPPVAVLYRHQDHPEVSPGQAVNDNELDKGCTEGPCLFAVQGMTINEYADMSLMDRKNLALERLRLGKGVLAYGSAPRPESIYHNPQLYPGLFPWLFPYGLGGFENERQIRHLPKKTHIKYLLTYYDRRFQTDEYFVFLLFNQQQIRDASYAGYSLVHKSNFRNVVDKILNIDVDALACLIERSKVANFIRPESEGEKRCLELLHLMDVVAGKVPISNTQKRYQRNEIRGLIYAKGLPFWFITFAPAEHDNSVALLINGLLMKDQYSKMYIPIKNDRLRSIARNPVACAKFFHFFVKTFLSVVLKVGTNEEGLFGKTSAYYGTVESQGRLTLHLHILVWIANALTPEEIRAKLRENEADFQNQLITWLESCYQGQFSTGNMRDIFNRHINRKDIPDDHVILDHHEDNPDGDDILNPILRRPVAPTEDTDTILLDEWYQDFLQEADDIALRCNRHTHHKDQRKDSCRKGRLRKCRARFPRPLYPHSTVEQDTGALFLKQQESWINCFSPLLTYLMRCNTDVTCLLSGTQVKAVVAYVSDYVTKSPLKTYSMFQAIKSVLEKREDVLTESPSRAEAARKLICKMVNALTARMETGGPMLCTHLLGYPDHYTDHRFKVFPWVSFVKRVRLATEDTAAEDDNVEDEMLVLKRTKTGDIIGTTKINDYIYRPAEFHAYCLYDFLSLTTTEKLTAKTRERTRAARAAHLSSDVQRQLEEEHAELDEEENDEEDDEPEDREREIDYKETFHFLPQHPNHDTHGVFLLKPHQRYLLNFVGGTLPRPDKGDHEEYCRAMLTIFHPNGWRNGDELKLAQESWTEAFERTQFKSAHRQVMKNMNLMYECLDARHDFATLRRAEERAELMGRYIGFDVGETLDLQHEMTSAEEDAYERQMLELLEESTNIIGRETARVQQKMDDMRRAFTTWQEAVPRYSADSARSESLIFTSNYPSTYWKQTLERAREDAQDNRARPQATNVHYTSSYPRVMESVTVVTLNGLLAYFQHSIPKQLTNNSTELAMRMGSIIDAFHLNADQTRAFSLIATQLSGTHNRPLLMYLGGMGGTGKSQIIKAIMTYLGNKGESHRVELCAPTGAAASLIGGSTYHSLLGFTRDDGPSSVGKLGKVRDRLGGIDLIFLDEVSMLSCLAMYRISEQMSNAFDTPLDAFGGKSIVLAGDFGQLPPPGMGQSSLYSGSVGTKTAGLTLAGQRRAIGKALWHMFDTHVLLRENMRQTASTKEDEAYRRLLTNARLKACDEDDFRLLDTITLGRNPSLSLTTMFQHTSIITAWNAHRDAINERGTTRFAEEHGESLKFFYSKDTLVGTREISSLRQTQKQMEVLHAFRSRTNELPHSLKETLWQLPPCMTDHIAGILPLCPNMPVMLKSNEATELCATNGAEGTVYGWDIDASDEQHPRLKTVFIRLTSPPRNIQIGDLPENVVPITAVSERIKCILPNDTTLWIQRTQIPILPNFAMTDFASQGRTRYINPIDIRHCKTHQAIYTCLSRSSTISGTLILAPFDKSKLTGGTSPDLRRELRELEIMNDITRMKFDGKLPIQISGSTRGELVREGWKNLSYEARVKRAKKHKGYADQKGEEYARKQPNNRYQGPVWDPISWSCAYDALLTILWNAHRDTNLLDKLQSYDTIVHNSLVSGFRDIENHTKTLETVRDELRAVLRAEAPSLHPHGHSLTSLDVVFDALIHPPTPVQPIRDSASQCHWATHEHLHLPYLYTAYPQLWERLSIPEHTDSGAVLNSLL
ncbi:hypothetical protein NM688_g1617 [Phlebia brevispora]|uniref:Uncharacterized protein n=1 Tax=Phlebia brevispora TaxID=194682 RepID=A0ACC1TAN7_9APHY|nr:hypothetical protein NM688_g1617 [Phlebia brevispora]